MSEPEEVELTFGGELRLTEDQAAALEDYARVLARCAAAGVLRAGDGDDAAIRGVRLREPSAGLPREIAADIEGFARSLAQGGGGGLGWS